MKPFRPWVLLVTALFGLAPAGVLRAQDEEEHRRAADVSAAFQTVFYAVLEGCFADGITDEDVDQMLRREGTAQVPTHFIYACPICMATQHALETYRSRAVERDQKPGNRKVTFGKGLTPEVHARLYSGDARERLAAIHDLEERWVARRIDALRLRPEELARVQEQLKAARDRGMNALQAFIQNGTVRDYAPGYREGDECALCNAAAGMKLKLAPPPADPSAP